MTSEVNPHRYSFSPEELHALVVMAGEGGIGPAELVSRTAIELIAAQATRYSALRYGWPSA